MLLVTTASDSSSASGRAGHSTAGCAGSLLGAPLVILGAVPPVEEDLVVEVVLGCWDFTSLNIPMLLIF